MKAEIEPATVRHRVGTCPACRTYLWADVTVQSRLSAPTLDADGRAKVGVHSEVIAMALHHECDKREDESA